MGVLQFRFLGPLEICSGDRRLPKPPTLKSQSLLAYLVLHRDQPQPRSHLAGLFWGDRPERKARSSLSTALWHIRHVLPDDVPLLSDLHTVQFDPRADIWLDVEGFKSQASHNDVASLESAVARYRGPLLDGFYDDWILNERYRLEALLGDALVRLIAGHEARGDVAAVLAAAQRLLNQDPLREEAHRAAMRAYVGLGRRNEALEQYHRCREIVQQELGAEPTAETSEMWRSILDGQFEVGLAGEEVADAVGSRIRRERVRAERARGGARSPLDAVAVSPLVGRGETLASLDVEWQAARAGEGGLVLVSGEAGVGKTRLLEAFADRLRWQGARVVWGRCYEFASALPYQPVAEALRTVVVALTSDQLADLPAWSLREVARLVPALSDQIDAGSLDPSGDKGAVLSSSPAASRDLLGGASEPSSSLDLGREQARLFDGLTRFLVELSSFQPILLVLEDLHWAGKSTLQLLHYLARHLAARHSVLMVGTFRPEALGLEHPLLTLRRRLTREGLAKPLRLTRLPAGAVERMVVEMSGTGEAVAPLAERLYQETDGNPFFLLETVKALFEKGVLRVEQGMWVGEFAAISRGAFPLPAAVGELIEARVRRLDERAQEALRMAAVLGQVFDLDLLRAAWDRELDTTLRALDALLRQRLVEEAAPDRDYAFSYHKIQQAVYAGIPRRRRQRLHAPAGRAMESIYAPEAHARASELAFHFRQAQQPDSYLTDKEESHGMSIQGNTNAECNGSSSARARRSTSAAQVILYLHGFLSSAKSTKARFLRERLEAFPHVSFRAIDFNPTPADFETMTTTGQINRLRQYVLDHGLGDVSLVGSSFGGLVALHYAHRFGGVTRMLLLAPAVVWLSGGLSEEELRGWEEAGAAPLLHPAFEREVHIRYDLQVDGMRYLDPVPPAAPTVIIHGRQDETVPIAHSRAYAADYPDHVRLIEVDADHDLNPHLDLIWDHVTIFLLGVYGGAE